MNQLLDGSISLSPLYPNLKINLHVRIHSNLHQSFPWLRPIQAQFTIFRVPPYMLILESCIKELRSADVDTFTTFTPLTFITLYGLPPYNLHIGQTPWSVFQDGTEMQGMGGMVRWLPIILGSLQTRHSRHYNKPYSTRIQYIIVSYPPTPLNLFTISSTISLFSQSSFHLSLTVLVRYRSLEHIQPQMEFTTHFELHSQTTRLQDSQINIHHFATGLSPSLT